jgi:hypothetical protein
MHTSRIILTTTKFVWSGLNQLQPIRGDFFLMLFLDSLGACKQSEHTRLRLHGLY